MDLAQEIADVDRQLAALDADRARESELRERRAELDELERLEQEKAQLARAKRDKLAAVKIAEDRDREAKAAPLVAALDVSRRELDDLETETERALWSFIRDVMRPFYHRRVAIVVRHNEQLAQLRAVDPAAAGLVTVRDPESLRRFAASRWSQFNGRGLAADGSCDWSRALAAEGE